LARESPSTFAPRSASRRWRCQCVTLEAVSSALAVGPSVVIFESSDPFQQFDLTTLAPHAVLIDVSTVITRGSVVAPCTAGLEQIVQAVRDSSTVSRPAKARRVRTLAAPTG